MAEPGFQTRSMGKKNKKGLALVASAPRIATPPPSDTRAPSFASNVQSDRAGTLTVGEGRKIDLIPDDLIHLKDLGAGNGGTVSKVRHEKENIIMARKIIHKFSAEEEHKRIVKELQIMHDCKSPYIVSFYGACYKDNDVIVCMEYMDVGSLDKISKEFGPIRVDILGKIAEALLEALTYLYSSHKIMHRDVKPGNILVNSRGEIKISDFGVSSAMEGSVANTFVGTGIYMAPERISGDTYTVKSDVWSVGMTLLELAVAKSPFSLKKKTNGNNVTSQTPGSSRGQLDARGDADLGDEDDRADEDDEVPQGILDLLQRIVMEEPPELPESDAFPKVLHEIIKKCLTKDLKDRPTPLELLETDIFIKAAKRTPVNLRQWTQTLKAQMDAQHQQTPKTVTNTLHSDISRNPGAETPRTASNTDFGMGELTIRDRQRPELGRISSSGVEAAGQTHSIRS